MAVILEVITTMMEYVVLFFDPIAKPVGMIILIVFTMGSVLYCTVWIIKKLWKLFVVTAASVFIIVILYTILPLITG